MMASASENVAKARILALHGKGTSTRIMRAQIKPLMDALEDVADFEFLQGKVPSAPYHGVERLFPNQPYLAWYETPTTEALEAAYGQVQSALSSAQNKLEPLSRARQVSGRGAFSAPFSPLPTPPATPKSLYTPTFGSLSPSMLASGDAAGRSLSSGSRTPQYLAPLVRTASHYPKHSLMSHPMTPPEEPPTNELQSRPFDGVICFSQGSAVAAGLLLDHFMQNRSNDSLTAPFRFAIFLCGGRPFRGLQRAAPHSTPTIKIPSLHIIGKQDPGLKESRLLSSLFDEEERTVMELDIGHAPPRMSSDVKQVAAATRRLIRRTS